MALFYSIHIHSFRSCFQFKSPSNRRNPPPPSPLSSAQNSHGYGVTALYGRRALIFSAPLPLLLDGFSANASEVDINKSPTIQDAVRKVLSKDKAPGVLRLVFHDAGTYDIDDNSGGMNGSIIYELDRPENMGLKKSMKILEKAKGELNNVRAVSWADLIAVGGAEAVLLCGGPAIPVQLGRLDSMIPDPQGKLPLETLDALGLKKCFMKKGFSTQELVALSGAHTLGSKGFGNPTVFDNSYFKVLIEKPWTASGGMSSMIGLPSDHALAEDDECLRWIRIYADDQTKFFEDFRNAYVKLVNTGAS